MYIWTVFHPDIKCAIWGDECETVEVAKEQAWQWVVQWVVPNEA